MCGLRRKSKDCKPKKQKFDSRPKKQTVVREHTRMISATRQIVVREHVRIISRGQMKKFKVTCPKDAPNRDLFNWKAIEKAKNLSPLIVEMSPEDFLFLTEKWKAADYSQDFEMAHGEKFDDMVKEFDEQTAKRIEQVEKHAAEIKHIDEQVVSSKEKGIPLAIVIGQDGQIRRHAQHSRERAEALLEMGVETLPVVILEEV